MRVSARLYKREGTDQTFDIEPGGCAACMFVAKFVHSVVNGVSFVEHEGELFMVIQLWSDVGVITMCSCEVVTPAQADAELERARLELH